MSAAIKTRPMPVDTSGAAEVITSQQFLLDDVTWDQYVAISDALMERSGLRITYDRGSLELMTKSPRHGWYERRIFIFVEILSEEMRQPIECLADMTFRKKELKRGFEPDDSFWIQHEPQMRGRGEWNPAVDPPPDLTIESEVTKSALNRMAIFASYKIPEVWRFDGERLYVHLLQRNGTYVEAPESLAFPGIPIAEIAPFMRPDPSIDILTLKQRFRAWVKQQLRRKKKT